MRGSGLAARRLLRLSASCQLGTRASVREQRQSPSLHEGSGAGPGWAKIANIEHRTPNIESTPKSLTSQTGYHGTVQICHSYPSQVPFVGTADPLKTNEGYFGGLRS
jgi:hypothetical protein